MADLAHVWGGDLAIGPSGDLAVAGGSTLGQQRVLRRLLTNAGDYIWQPGYGAGLAARVGDPAAARPIQAAIRSQVFAEACVAPVPEPAIAVSAGIAGSVYVQVRYTDAASGQSQLLQFSLDA